MLTRPRTQLSTVIALIVAAVLCQVIAHATYHRSGLLGLISWVTFIGFWVVLIALAVVLVLLVAGLIRNRSAVRS